MKQDGIMGRHTQDAEQPKQGITLDEMDEFVQAARAKRIAGATKVQVFMNWNQAAKRLRVEGYVIDDGERDTDEKH